MKVLIRYIYSMVLYALVPVIVIRLLYRSFRAPAYRKRWGQRFGFAPKLTDRKTIWLHAVSVGETLAAVPLIKALQKKYPTYRLMVTCMTPTGSQRIQAAFGDSVDHSYAPYDMPDAVARFLNRVEPELLIIMETELWPNTIAACRRRNIPVILANARLSEKSARGYQKIALLVKPMLQSMDAVVAQHQDDGARFIDLGLPEQALSISGNIKFDLTLDAGMHNQAQQLSQAWRGIPPRPIWLAASTHRGEDEIILRAHRQMVEQLQQPPLLVLVPRHPERFDAVENLCRSAGFEVARRSHTDLDIAKADILLGDTMGELMLFYGACDLAFVGGSLVPNGGHNMIEPAAWGVPILTGPHLFNFSDVSQLLIRGGGMKVCDSDTSLAAECLGLLQNAGHRQAMGEAAQQVAEANRGALLKLLAAIECQLPVNPCS
jgi:3-deoxy-D-manno-octulosonic-acid transferase